MSYPLLVDWNMQMSHINEEHNMMCDGEWCVELSHSEQWPLKVAQHAHISRLVIPPMDASLVFLPRVPSCFIRYRVDNAVDKRITQASQAIGVLQKSVCLDNPLYCMWRLGPPHAEICSSFIYYQYMKLNGMGKHISVDRG